MSDLAGKRVLVSGAAGFIGANLVRALLERGVEVSGLVRPDGSSWRLEGLEGEIDLISVDARDRDAVLSAVAGARPELAVNLVAAPGHPETSLGRHEHLAVSVLGTASFVEAVARAGCTALVHLGSSFEYGPKKRSIAEGDLLQPTVPRGAAKAAATLVCLAWSWTLGIAALVLRPFSVYGPWEDETRLVPSALHAALTSRELPLTEPGIVHDFVYVADVVDAVLRGLCALPGAAGEVINVGTGVQTTNEELVVALERIVGRELPVLSGAYPVGAHDARCWAASVEHCREVLGWTPPTGLEEGLRLTLAWLEARTATVRP